MGIQFNPQRELQNQLHSPQENSQPHLPITEKLKQYFRGSSTCHGSSMLGVERERNLICWNSTKQWAETASSSRSSGESPWVQPRGELQGEVGAEDSLPPTRKLLELWTVPGETQSGEETETKREKQGRGVWGERGRKTALRWEVGDMAWLCPMGRRLGFPTWHVRWQPAVHVS